MAGRACYAKEVSPVYLDVAVKRWSKFTGRAPVLADDGRKPQRLATCPENRVIVIDNRCL
jgi:DNA modification methylase